jgi:hypothetical protein
MPLLYSILPSVGAPALFITSDCGQSLEHKPPVCKPVKDGTGIGCCVEADFIPSYGEFASAPSWLPRSEPVFLYQRCAGTPSRWSNRSSRTRGPPPAPRALERVINQYPVGVTWEYPIKPATRWLRPDGWPGEGCGPSCHRASQWPGMFGAQTSPAQHRVHKHSGFAGSKTRSALSDPSSKAVGHERVEPCVHVAEMLTAPAHRGR